MSFYSSLLFKTIIILLALLGSITDIYYSITALLVYYYLYLIFRFIFVLLVLLCSSSTYVLNIINIMCKWISYTISYAIQLLSFLLQNIGPISYMFSIFCF